MLLSWQQSQWGVQKVAMALITRLPSKESGRKCKALVGMNQKQELFGFNPDFAIDSLRKSQIQKRQVFE